MYSGLIIEYFHDEWDITSGWSERTLIHGMKWNSAHVWQMIVLPIGFLMVCYFLLMFHVSDLKQTIYVFAM